MMTPEENAKLLATLSAAYEHFHPDRAVAAVWHRALEGEKFEEMQAAAFALIKVSEYSPTIAGLLKARDKIRVARAHEESQRHVPLPEHEDQPEEVRSLSEMLANRMRARPPERN